ncbi:C-5 sterol desaturase, partial [Globisporangium splendens]
MDLVLELTDEYLLDALYPATLARDALLRQVISVSAITLVGGALLYLSGAGFAYAFFFDKQLMQHPRFLDKQLQREIVYSLQSIPVMTVLMLPWFLAEVRGCTRMYKDVSEYGWTYLVASIPLFLVFTDMLIYWFHRWLHHPLVYAKIHKPHHKWIITTPFASHAFHPVDGFIQGLPYHLFPLVLPIHRVVFLVMFTCVNYWTISIHDGLHVSKNSWLNGAAHHTVHHTDFVYNYGQYFTFWDRVAGSYKEPPHAEPEKEKDQ